MENPRKEAPGLSRSHEDCRGLREEALEDFYWAFKRSRGKWTWLGEREGCVHHARALTWRQVEGNSSGSLGEAWSQLQAEARTIMPCLPVVQLWSLSRNHSFSEIPHPGLSSPLLFCYTTLIPGVIYSLTLSNTGLNCLGLLICKCFQ